MKSETSSQPKLKEFFTFLLLGPPVGMAFIGVTARSLPDLFIGIEALFSPIAFLCYFYGFPSAFLTGLAWAFASTPIDGKLPSRTTRFASAILTGGFCGLILMVMLMEKEASAWWSYVLHGLLSATLCCSIVEAMRKKVWDK